MIKGPNNASLVEGDTIDDARTQHFAGLWMISYGSYDYKNIDCDDEDDDDDDEGEV